MNERFSGYIDNEMKNIDKDWKKELFLQLKKIQSEFSFDIDVEWTIDKFGNFKIFQVRPITSKEVFYDIKKE